MSELEDVEVGEELEIGVEQEDRPVNGQDVSITPKAAFKLGDADLSRIAHDAKAFGGAPEAHKTATGEHVKSVVFGGLDGIITTFAVVAGVAGANLSKEVVLVLGFANLIADGISMGFGDYLSSKAEMEYTQMERSREAWEMDHYPDGEKREMVEIYMGHGYSEDDAKTVIDILAQNKKWFVDHMMVEELGMMPPSDDDDPAKSGFITFVAFLIFGFIPLLAYLIFPASEQNVAFAVACILTALTLLLLGYVKAKMTGRPTAPSAIGVLANGTVAAAAAYLVGWGLGAVTDVEHCG